jgi:hypothetical protein
LEIRSWKGGVVSGSVLFIKSFITSDSWFKKCKHDNTTSLTLTSSMIASRLSALYKIAEVGEAAAPAAAVPNSSDMFPAGKACEWSLLLLGSSMNSQHLATCCF